MSEKEKSGDTWQSKTYEARAKKEVREGETRGQRKGEEKNPKGNLVSFIRGHRAAGPRGGRR